MIRKYMESFIKNYMGGIGCVIILLIPIGLISVVWFDMTFNVIGENISHKGDETRSITSFLPDQATNISFWRNRRHVYYECHVSEKDALEFASKQEWTMQPIGEKPVIMHCYFFDSTGEPQRSCAMEHFGTLGENKYYPFAINEGYYSNKTMNKGGFHIVYDTSLSKLFFSF